MTQRQIVLFLALGFVLVETVERHKYRSSFLKFEPLREHLQKRQRGPLSPPTWREEGDNFRTFEGFPHFDQRRPYSWDKNGAVFSTSAARNRKSHEEVSNIGESSTSGHSFAETSQSLIKSLCKVKGETKVCYNHGQSVCRCRGQLADCSGKPYVPNVAYAPKLPPEIKCLIFQHNNAAYLDDSYFANVSDFRVIDFSNNKLRTVSRKTFARFNGNLEYLILSSNVLTYSNIRKVLSFPPSKRLDLIDNGLSSPIPKNFFQPFAGASMSELYLDLNFIQILDFHEFSVLKNLQYLGMKNCSINELKSDVMPSLIFLDLENNPISSFPQTCRNISIVERSFLNHTKKHQEQAMSMFPKLKGLTIGNTKIITFPAHTDLCLPKLELLFMFLNNISTFHSHSLQSLKSIRVLILDRMKSNISKIESNAFSSSSLISLHLTKNHITFGSKNISDLMFQDCPSLEVLHLDHNNFLNVSEESYEDIFSNLSKLTSLYMGSSQVTFIPTKALAHLTNVQRLYLYLNKISYIPPAAFDAMSSLEYLFLDENQIATVRSQSFSSETIKRLKEVDMNRNNFQCTCDLLWFQSWLVKEGPAKFYDFPKGYTCADRPGTMVSEFVLSKQACMFSRKTYILFTVCLSILIVCVVAFSIVFRYRWHIRLALYEWRSTRATTTTTEHQERPDVTHDVFIVYCNDDSSWVVDELLPRVEVEWGLRAFIHERDFQAGRYIVDNTVLAMNACRHVMVVLSTRFAASNWCNFELMLCQSHVIEHDLPSILVVELERTAPHQMSPVMTALRSTTTFLEWPEDPRGDGMFWRKLETCVKTMRPHMQR